VESRRGAALVIDERPCVHTRALVPLVDTRQHVGVHSDCQANEIVAIRNRVVMIVPPVLVPLGALLDHEPVYDVLPLTEAQVLSRLVPKRRKRYVQAFDAYHTFGLLPKHSNVQAFLKAEKVDDDDKDPRMIQHRHPVYTSQLARYIGALEPLINTQGQEGVEPVWYAKGMNSYGVAKHLRMLWDRAVFPTAVLCDASRFDAHVQVQHLALEHSYYDKVFNSRRLRYLLKQQLHNKCYSKLGVRYTVPGGRMSGDRNTSLGNSLINRAVQFAVHPKAIGMAIVGDDAVIILDGDTDVSPSTYLPFGFNVKLDVVNTFEHIRFCQTQPVQISTGTWRMSRDPRRAMTRDVFTTHGDQARDRRLEAISLCLLATGRGLPIFQELAAYLHRDVRPLYVGDDLELRAHREPGKMARRPVAVGAETRASFAVAFDMPVDQQLAVEAALRSREPYDFIRFIAN
jgi:hypothetical protein